MNTEHLADDVLCIGLAKGRHRFIICYNSATESQARWQLCRWAADPQFAFTWKDAALMDLKLREQPTLEIDYGS
jgi:hypothetical protein